MISEQVYRQGSQEGCADDELAIASAVEAARHDPAAFGNLYQRYLPRIYSYMRTRASGDDEAADLTQQVFLKALSALPSYEQRGVPFAAWLFRIARNLAVDAHRHRNRSGESGYGLVSWDSLPAALHPATTTDDEPEAALLRWEATARLRTLLSGLDPDKREMLALRFAARLTAREIGLVVGKSEEAVQKQLNRTLHTLREQYDEE